MIDELERIGETKEERLLREIREDFSYFKDYWRENFEEAKTDLRFVSGDPWDADQRKEREDNGRPVVSPDELEQYLNATINNLRQNKRAIKVNPAGAGADNKDADRRSALIRGIEYKSNAQSAYTNAFEGAINCGIGHFRITTARTGRGREVEPRIRIIENPLSVLLDPDAKEADFSDQKRCFVLDTVRERDFTRKYPQAEHRGFSIDDFVNAPGWLEGEAVVVAEYWRIDGYDEDGEGGKVTQYITNGLEILEENPWPGSWIPIIPVLGKKIFVPAGGQMKRMFYSMIRKARGPQMMLAYIASQEAEEYGMAPRAPMVGYKGQFETDLDAWRSSNKVPTAFLQVDPVTDEANALLPLPQRMPFVPNASAYEVGFERWRRSVQAAMGITPLPTAAQRQNEKSGVALQRIENQQAIGAYHFTDNFDRSLENAGRQLDELVTIVMDTARQVGVRHADDSHHLMHVVPKGEPLPEDANPQEVFDPGKGEFDVTISTGPSYQSQREEASAFVDLLVQNINTLPVAPPAKAALLSKAISLKNIGPIGDEIAKILNPQGDGEPLPPQAQAALGELQQQLQVAHMVGNQMHGEIQKLQFEKQAKLVEQQGKMEQIAAQSRADLALEDKKLETQLAVAEISTKAQSQQEREAFVGDMAKQLVGQAHDSALMAQEAAHDRQAMAQQAGHDQDMASQQAAAQSAQSAQDAAQSQQAAQAESGSPGEPV